MEYSLQLGVANFFCLANRALPLHQRQKLLLLEEKVSTTVDQTHRLEYFVEITELYTTVMLRQNFVMRLV
jgi:hypothetical protein